jgi:hypothetical protein
MGIIIYNGRHSLIATQDRRVGLRQFQQKCLVRFIAIISAN